MEIALLDCWKRKKDLISMYREILVSGFVNISVSLNKSANNFKPLDRFFKRIKILLVIQTENLSATSSFSYPLKRFQSNSRGNACYAGNTHC